MTIPECVLLGQVTSDDYTWMCPLRTGHKHLQEVLFLKLFCCIDKSTDIKYRLIVRLDFLKKTSIVVWKKIYIHVQKWTKKEFKMERRGALGRWGVWGPPKFPTWQWHWKREKGYSNIVMENLSRYTQSLI